MPKRKHRKITKVNRPPLSKKAKRAIHKYVELKSEFPTMLGVVNWTLKADRMPRDKLYSYLEYRGYHWDANSFLGWQKK